MWGDLPRAPADPQGLALVRILDRLKAAGYRFTAVNASTHRRVAGRRERARPGSLRDILGWGLPFEAADLPADLLDDLDLAAALVRDAGTLRVALRVSSVGEDLFLHSADRAAPDAVFLGPDTHRFVRFLRSCLADGFAFERAADVGAGAGVGAVVLAGLRPGARVWATDVNPEALRLTRLNAAHAGRAVTAVRTSGLDGLDGPFDLIVANPPFIAQGGRLYRDGGDGLGTAVTLDWLAQAADRLAPGGRIVFYTGAPVVDGRDRLRDAVETLASDRRLSLAYDEIDPDIFGSTLAEPAYRQVERIAAVGLTLAA